MENIDIPEIEKVANETEKVTETESVLVKYYMDGDLKNLETSVRNYFMTPAPLLSLTEDIKNKVKHVIKDENFTLMPGVTDNDLKSLVYISTLSPSIIYQNNLNILMPVPATTPVLKYDVKDFTDDNLNIAYDLFLFNLYIRNTRRNLENKIEDVIENRALFNIQLRSFTDPIVFTFIDKVDKTKLSSIILSRYKYFDSIGVFDFYKDLLKTNNCPEITESDILSVVDEAVEKVVGKSPYIDILHTNMEDPNKLRVSAKNDLSLEQIINEVLPLEIAEKTGKNLKNEQIINQIKETHNISDEIIELFLNDKKKKTTKKETTKVTSNLERLIRTQFIDEVPEQYRVTFMKNILELGNNKFDLENAQFPIDEFGDNVIKALYLWDPENDPIVSKNYKKYFLKVEQELMERDLILAKIKIKEAESNADGGGWDFSM
jgi:hypothetical protein